MRYDLGCDEQLLNLCIAHVHNDNPNLTVDEVKRVARNVLRENNPRNPEWIAYHIKVQREYSATQFGILSCSTRNDSILMWSHYSNYHRGVCIRFNSDISKDQKVSPPKNVILRLCNLIKIPH